MCQSKSKSKQSHRTSKHLNRLRNCSNFTEFDSVATEFRNTSIGCIRILIAWNFPYYVHQIRNTYISCAIDQILSRVCLCVWWRLWIFQNGRTQFSPGAHRRCTPRCPYWHCHCIPDNQYLRQPNKWLETPFFNEISSRYGVHAWLSRFQNQAISLKFGTPTSAAAAFQWHGYQFHDHLENSETPK